MLKSSSKLCVFLSIICDKVLLHIKKSIVWCINSVNQEFVVSALSLCEIDTRVLHTKMNNSECHKLIHEFTIDFKKAMVLICFYYVNSAKSNLQALCCNVHLWDISFSKVILMQAIEWVRKLGQKKIVKIYNYMMKNSFNMWQLLNNMNKIILNMIAELNINLFFIFYKNDVKKIELDYWAKNEDDTLFQIPTSLVKHVSNDKIVTEDDLIYALLNAMKDEKFKIHSNSDYAIEV